MMLFDFLIGNSDRHQNNWALLVEIATQPRFSMQFSQCPLYDNGSSLCCYVKESDVDTYLGNDQLRFESLVDSKSKSMIRIDGTKKARPSHKEVVKYLMGNYPAAKSISARFADRLSKEVIDTIMDQYSEEILSPKAIIARCYPKYIQVICLLWRKSPRMRMILPASRAPAR